MRAPRRRRTSGVVSRPTSWFEPIQHGTVPSAGARPRSTPTTRRISSASSGVCTKAKLKARFELVAARSVEARPRRRGRARTPRPRGCVRLVRVGEARQLAQDLVRLRPVQRVDAPFALRAAGIGLVPQLPVLDQRVCDVDPEAGDAAVEPEAEDALELRSHARVPPVEVGLLGREVVQVVAPALRVDRPRRFLRRTRASCSAPRPPRRSTRGARGTTDGGRTCGSGRGRAGRGSPAGPPRRSRRSRSASVPRSGWTSV